MTRAEALNTGNGDTRAEAPATFFSLAFFLRGCHFSPRTAEELGQWVGVGFVAFGGRMGLGWVRMVRVGESFCFGVG